MRQPDSQLPFERDADETVNSHGKLTIGRAMTVFYSFRHIHATCILYTCICAIWNVIESEKDAT